MSLCDEDVFPAIVVVIDEFSTPAGIGKRRVADTGVVGRILEVAIAEVPIESVHFLREVRDEDVRQAVVVVVREVHAHSGEGLAILVVSGARLQRDLLESSIPLVAIEEGHYGVVRDVDVGPPVAVVVRESYAQPLAVRVGDARILRDVGECAVTIIPEKDVGDAFEVVGMAVSLVTGFPLAAVNVLLEGPIQIAAHEQVELAVVVVVEEARARAPTGGGYSRLRSHILERPSRSPSRRRSSRPSQ